MLSVRVNGASVLMLLVPVVCLWAGVNCHRPIHRRQRRTLRRIDRSGTLDLQLRCSRPLGRCSRSRIHANRSTQIERSSRSVTNSNRMTPQRVLSSVLDRQHDWRYVQNHHLSRFKVQNTTPVVMPRLRVSTPAILPYTANLVTSRGGHFCGPE